MDGGKRSYLLSLCGQLLRQVLPPCHIKEEETSNWIRISALSYAAEMDGHVLATLCAVTMALLTNRLDLCIQGLFGAGNPNPWQSSFLHSSNWMSIESSKFCFYTKKTLAPAPSLIFCSGLTPQRGGLRWLGRLVGDQESNKSNYSHTRFNINPKERRQMLNKCQLVMATGGTVAQDLTM